MLSNRWEVHRQRLAWTIELRNKGQTFQQIAATLNVPKDRARSLYAKAQRLARLPQVIIESRVRSGWSALPTSDLMWTDYLSVPAREATRAVVRLNRSSHFQTRLFEHRLKP